MSGTAVVRYLLANNANLIAQVPAARIFAGVIPLNSTLPAISVAQISSIQRLNVAMNTTRLTTERVQITVAASTYPLTKTILGLVRSTLPLSRGTVNGFAVDSILPDSEGPDIYDATALIYFQSQDVIVKFAS